MKKYRCTRRIESAGGTQTFTTHAESPAEALEKFKTGKSEFEHEEVDIQELSKPELSDIEDITYEDSEDDV